MIEADRVLAAAPRPRHRGVDYEQILYGVGDGVATSTLRSPSRGGPGGA